MKWHKIDKYIPMPVFASKRGNKKKSRVFKLDEMDGFYVDNEMDRAVHITFEEEDVVVIDIYDRAKAAIAPIGETLGIIELNLKTGKAKFFKEER